MRKILFIFGILNDADVDWMVRAGKRRQIGGGDILIQEGRAFDSVALLLSDRMAVSVDGIGEVAQLASGDFIGEMSLVDSARRRRWLRRSIAPPCSSTQPKGS